MAFLFLSANGWIDRRRSFPMIPHMIKSHYFVTWILYFFATTGCDQKSMTADNRPLLRVGMDLSYPPFEMQDKSGDPDGVSVKIAEALAAYLERRIKIVPMEFSGLIPALKTNNIDLIISSMTETDDRRKSIDFSKPYAFIGLALLVGKDSDIQSINDLNQPGRTVTTKASTTSETWAIEHLPNAKRVVFEDQTACVLEVAQGRADAFIYDQLSIYQYAEKNQGTTRALLKPFIEESWAIGIAKGNEELLKKVDSFLDDFRRQNGLEKLGERYLKNEKKSLDQAGIPFILR